MKACLGKVGRAVAAFGLALVVASAAPAQNSERDLLDRLRTAETAEAMRIEAELVVIWSRSGSDSMDLLLERGRDALGEGRVEEAIEHLTALTDHAPDFAEGWNARAIAYFHAGLYGPSISDIAMVLTLNPNHFGALTGLATMLEEMERYDAALAALKHVQAIHPSRQNLKAAIDRVQKKIGTSDI